jgi:hypothetical protein
MAEVVASLLRSQVACGELTDGDALPSEKDLTDRFGNGRAEDHWRRHVAAIAKGPAVSDPDATVDVDRLAEAARPRRDAGFAVTTLTRARSVVG